MASNMSMVDVGDDGDLIINPEPPFSRSLLLAVALAALAALLVCGLMRKKGNS